MNVKEWIIILIAASVVNAEEEYADYRLPGDIIPKHYDVRILVDLSTDFVFKGKMGIDFLAVNTTDKIVIHSKNLKIFENETKVEDFRPPLLDQDTKKNIRRPKEIEGSSREKTSDTDEVLPNARYKRSGEIRTKMKPKTPDQLDLAEEIDDSKDEPLTTTEKTNDKKDNVSVSVEKEGSIKSTQSPVNIGTESEKSPQEFPTTNSNHEKATVSSSAVTEERKTTERGFVVAIESTPRPATQDDRIHFITPSETTPVAFKYPTPSTHVSISALAQATQKTEYSTPPAMVHSPEHSTSHGGVHSPEHSTSHAVVHSPEHSTSHGGVHSPEHSTSHAVVLSPEHSTSHAVVHSPEHSASHSVAHSSEHSTSHGGVHSTEHSTSHSVAHSSEHPTTHSPKHSTTYKPTTSASTSFVEPTKVSTPQVKNNYGVVKHEYDLHKNFLTIHLNKPLEAGKKYKLYLKYRGVLTDTLTGFHRVPYVKKNTQISTWLATTVFQPNEARTAFPCFDEPAMKATFDITLGHDKKFTALSNMPLKATSQVEGKTNWQWSTFDTTPKMSTYLVAFLISDLEYLIPRQNYTENGPNVTYRFWARPGVLYKTRYAMRIAPEMKNYLENLLGVRDVIPKYDFVALPSFISSALENWGLYSFEEKSLLFTPGFSSIFSKYEITRIIGHETAHLWFGNMVTPKWWNQIWLSEGFSNFFENLAANHVQPNWDVETISVIHAYLKVYSLDALRSSHPLVPKLRSPNDLNEIFDSISYQKGYYLVRMLNYTLGQEAFMNGVREYLRTYLFSNTDENDLWKILTKHGHNASSIPKEYHLKDIMRNWTRKTGYPIINVTRNYENNTATVTQRRFLRSKDDYESRRKDPDSEDEGTKWWIPLTYTTGSELNFRDNKPRLWLSPHEGPKTLTDMPSKNDFVLMNINAAGLYRVNYDLRNWNLLISYLINENHSEISVINRVQILDDLLDLARAGEISYDRALEATSYLAKERHFLPWKAALSNFDFISRMLKTTDSSRSFKKFIRKLVAPRFEELGFESIKNESLSDGLNRKQIVKWACKTGLRQCTRRSIGLFRRWADEEKPDEHNPIPSSLRGIVYCAAIENGNLKDWQFLWQRYLSNVITERSSILYGLGCTKNTRILRRYLDWSLTMSSGIRKQDTPTVFKAVVRNDAGFNLAKNFLKERMGDIKKYLGNDKFYLPQMIETMAAKMNQPAHLKELEELEQDHFTQLRSSPRSFKQAIERVKFNIQWIEKHHQQITHWLRKHKL